MVKTKSRTRKQLKYTGGSGFDNINLQNLTINEDEQEICSLCSKNIDINGVPRIERCMICKKPFHRRCLARHCQVMLLNGDQGTDPELIRVRCPNCLVGDRWLRERSAAPARQWTCQELLNDTRSSTTGTSTTGTNTSATTEGAVVMDPNELDFDMHNRHLIEYNDTEVNTNNAPIVGDDSSSDGDSSGNDSSPDGDSSGNDSSLDGDSSGNDEGVQESKFMEPLSTSSEEDQRDSDKDIEDFMKSFAEHYGVEQPLTRPHRILEDEFITKINELGLNKEHVIQKTNELLEQQEKSDIHKESGREDRRIINEDLKESARHPYDVIIYFNNPPDSDDTTLIDRSYKIWALFENYKNAHPNTTNEELLELFKTELPDKYLGRGRAENIAIRILLNHIIEIRPSLYYISEQGFDLINNFRNRTSNRMLYQQFIVEIDPPSSLTDYGIQRYGLIYDNIEQVNDLLPSSISRSRTRSDFSSRDSNSSGSQNAGGKKTRRLRNKLRGGTKSKGRKALKKRLLGTSAYRRRARQTPVSTINFEGLGSAWAQAARERRNEAVLRENEEVLREAEQLSRSFEMEAAQAPPIPFSGISSSDDDSSVPESPPPPPSPFQDDDDNDNNNNDDDIISIIQQQHYNCENELADCKEELKASEHIIDKLHNQLRECKDANEKISNDYINSLEHLQLLPPYNQIPAPTQAHTPPPASSPAPAPAAGVLDNILGSMRNSN